MSIATELTALQGHIADAYDAVNTKGGTIPANKNMANLDDAILSIPAGSSAPSSQPIITSYNSSTGVLSGENLGASGTIYLFDRSQNNGVVLATSSWSDTSIALSTPVDLTSFSGTTSIWAELPDGSESTKLMLFGSTQASGYGEVYYDDSGTVKKVTIASSTEFDELYSSGSTSITIGGDTFLIDQVVGVEIGPSVTSISDGFLIGCEKLNQPINASNVTEIGTYFLNHSVYFNQPINFPELLEIDASFMNSCPVFNQPISFPKLTGVWGHFLSKAYAFNSAISMPLVTYVGGYFLENCYAFNQPLYFPLLSSISEYFLTYNYAFNSEISLPSLTSIGNYFMNYCYNFDKQLALSGVTSIGRNFLYNCINYSHKITLGSASVSATSFMYNTKCTELDVGNSTLNEDTVNTYTLATGYSSYVTYDHGTTLTGTNASTWKAAISDSSSAPYRKIIDGTV